MTLKNIMHGDEIESVDAIIKVVESTYIQCVEYMEVARECGRVTGEITEDGSIRYSLEEINEELSEEGVHEDAPVRLIKMFARSIKAEATHMVIVLDASSVCAA